MSGADALSVSALTRLAPATRSTRVGAQIDATGVLNGDESHRSTPDSGQPEPHQCPPHGLPSGVIHELRTPLTSIHGYAQVLQRTMKDEPRAANAIAVMTRESSRLAAMLSLLSELAEHESGEPLGAPIEVDLSQIVQGAVEEVQRRDGDAHPITLDGDATAQCHPPLLSQTLIHLLTNAVRYSEAGRAVSVTIEETPTEAEIVVADEGMGIDEADLERLFGPFTRGVKAKEFGVRGLGLGLYLARQAAEQMNGQLTAEARPTGGSLFRLRLPRDRHS